MTDPRDLDPFLDAAVAEAERATSRPPPSFAAVLARAHSLAPDAVPPPAVTPPLTALPSEHVLKDMHEDAELPGPHLAALAPFVAAARLLAEGDTAARLRRPPPPLPRPRRRALPLALAAAAAVVLLALGASLLPGVADPSSGALAGAQADATVRDQPREHTSRLRAPEPTATPRAHPLDMTFETGTGPAALQPDLDTGLEAAVPQQGRALNDMSLKTDSDPRPPQRGRALNDMSFKTDPDPRPPQQGRALHDTSHETGPRPPPPAPAPRPRASAADPIAVELARLDDEAEELLLAGALDAADERYQQMIALGGRRRAVEHAYADRWLLARRAGDDARHQQLLRAYLVKFPRGRFADDASAGLCRAAAAAERPTCWRDYLEKFPAGAYRREAEGVATP